MPKYFTSGIAVPKSPPLTAVYYFLALALLLTYSLPAQVMGNYEVQQRASGNISTHSNVNFTAQYRGVARPAEFIANNQIEISINALANQRADSYTAIFSILQVGKTAAEANELINKRINAMKAGMARIGITAADVHVDMVNFLPKYEYEVSRKIFSKTTYTEVPSGFEIQKNVHIRYRDAELLDGIITTAAEQEVYDIVKVDYFIESPQAVYTQLRETAFAYLAELEAMYAANGIPLDSSYRESAESAWVAYPANRYEGYQAFSSQRLPSSAGSANVNQADKPYARFYNAIPANDYDIVINPNILEPAVQFSYNLKIRFTLPVRVIPSKTVVQEQYLILTTDGKLVRMNINEDEQ